MIYFGENCDLYNNFKCELKDLILNVNKKLYLYVLKMMLYKLSYQSYKMNKQ